ncbi:MAG: TRM11 family SAM-dependent methyltransferase, partial [Armatimonadota bacterium]
ECLYTRKGEFKLYRLPESRIRDFHAAVLATFIAKAEQNIQGMAEFNAEVDRRTCVQVFQSDTRHRQPTPNASVDLVVTSPPYGDSQTTVAYGQFSRLSLQWLGLPCEEAKSVDRRSLGGKGQSNIHTPLYLSESLESTVGQIFQRDARRARQVKAFYDDFAQCLVEITRVCRSGAKACFVVGNRTVRGIRIPTDLILREMAEGFGWRFVEQFERRIPNNRMPLQNSPFNVPGERGETMTIEHVVVLKRVA